MIHNRFRHAEAWANYRQHVREGRVFAPCGRNYPVFVRQTLTARGAGVAFRQDVPKRSTLLDDINNKILRAEVFVFFLAMSGRLSKNRQYFNDLALIHIDTTCMFEHAAKMLIDHQQLHIVRLSLDMSTRDLARVKRSPVGPSPAST
jgi:hypothetical protein